LLPRVRHNGTPALGLHADGCRFHSNANPEGKWIMHERSYNSRFAVEALEGRSMMSAVAEADFNNDGRLDKAVVTSPTTITVSLQNADTSYTVSAILTTPKNRPVGTIVNVVDFDSDGDLDIGTAGNLTSSSWYVHRWLNNGNGTFGSITTEVFRWKHHGFF
jgi:hypothetical protein